MHISMGKNMEKPQDKGETLRNTHLKRDTKATIKTQTKGTHPQKSSRMLKLSLFELEHDIQIILHVSIGCFHGSHPIWTILYTQKTGQARNPKCLVAAQHVEAGQPPARIFKNLQDNKPKV